MLEGNDYERKRHPRCFCINNPRKQDGIEVCLMLHCTNFEKRQNYMWRWLNTGVPPTSPDVHTLLYF